MSVSPNIGFSVGGLAPGNSALAPGPCGFTPASQLKVPCWILLPFSLPIKSRSYSPLATVWAFSEDRASPIMPAADFCGTVRVNSSTLSQFPWHATSQDTPQISRGKFDSSRYTTAGFTVLALDGYGLRDLTLPRPAFPPLYPVPVRRLVSLFHASFRPHFAVAPLRFPTLLLHQDGRGLAPPSSRTCPAHVRHPRHCRWLDE
jgi:hypothetical protein